MNAFELYNEKGSPTGVWCCGKCRKLTLNPPHTIDKAQPASTKEAAEACCNPCFSYCFTCQKFTSDVSGGECDSCKAARSMRWQQEQNDREQKLLEAAEDVTGNYDGPVYLDGCGGDMGEGYFSSVQSLVEDQFDPAEPEALPEFVHCCTSTIEVLDIGTILEQLCSDGYEGMEDSLTVPESLKAAIAEFNKVNEQALTVWNVDTKRKVRVFTQR